MGSKKTVIFFITFLTAAFCICIATDFIPFLRGPAPYPPDWQWDYLFVNTFSKLWVPGLFIGMVLSFVWFLEKTPESFIKTHEKKVLFFCIILFFFIQLSVTFFSRAGIGVLFARIANPDMNGYFTAANAIEDIPLFLQNFNKNVLSLPMHAQGHPPGAILFFWVIEHTIRPGAHIFKFLIPENIAHGDVSVIWESLTLSQKLTAIFSSVFIPFISAFSCGFVYYIGKYFYGIRSGIRSVFLFMTIPSLLLFIPINDVFLPLFPLAAFLLFIKGLGNKKAYLLFLSGVIFAVGLFFSLSLVPLIFIFGAYLLSLKKLKAILIEGAYFSLGIIGFPLFLSFFFGYDTFVVSQTLLSGLPENRQYFTWVFFNLSDFFIFLGIPLFVFFCLLIFQTIKNIIYFRQISVLSVGFILMLLILDISGTVRGEVARIWIPFYPFLVIILAQFLTKQMKIAKDIFLFVIFLQFIQVLFMQEFWVMLW